MLQEDFIYIADVFTPEQCKKLIDEFEIAFNIEINIEEATTFVTIQDAINYIEKKRINHDQIELP